MIEEDIPEEFEQIVVSWTAEAVKQALRLGDAQAFLDWMRGDAVRDYPAIFPAQEPALVAQLATQLGYMLWNALPLPDNGLRPRPLPQPRRNGPCPCGSGRKFKQCCAQLPALLTLDTEMLLPVVIDAMDADQIDQALSQRRLAPGLVARIANRLLEQDDRPERAVELLEPMFRTQVAKLDYRHDFAMNVLCDAYDRLGHRDKKLKLLKRLCSDAGRELGGGAWQRLAVMYQDQGDFDRGWEAFHQAQRANPDDPALALLEVTLLSGQGRGDEAVERARFWRARLQRLDGVDEHMLDWLSEVIDNPMGTLSDLYGGHHAPGLERLRAFIDRSSSRPLPAYRADVASPPAEPSPAGARQGAKAPDGQLSLFDDAPRSPPDGEHGRPIGVLETPAHLVAIETRWRQACALHSTAGDLGGAVDPAAIWEQPMVSVWLEFLEQHADAADSLLILDDLSAMLYASGGTEQPWTRQALLQPLLERASAIFERAWAAAPAGACLPWGFHDNRALLRLLEQYAELAMFDGDLSAAMASYERVLALNPNDNQGVRAQLMNLYLTQGRDQDALALAARFPEDLLPELAFGRVLALFRLGNRPGAQEALNAALKYHPHVVPYLLARKPAQPEPDSPHGLVFGGKEQAWLYQEAVGELWRGSDGLLKWLRKGVG